jgi:hypothetical protein
LRKGALTKRLSKDQSVNFCLFQEFASKPEEALEIDLEYYKQEILQPWMRIFTHLEEFNEDKLFEAFEVKDADRKKIK